MPLRVQMYASKNASRCDDKVYHLKERIEGYKEIIADVQKFIDKKKNGDETPWSKCPCAYGIKDRTKKEVSLKSCEEYINIMTSEYIEFENEIIKLTVFESRKPIRFVIKSRDTKRRKLNVFETED